MSPVQIPAKNSTGFSRCEERSPAPNPGKSLSPIQQMDLALKESIYHAFWKDDVLRAIEYYAVDVHVHEGIVHLYGHVVSTNSQSRIMNAIRAVSGILSVQNHLVLDERLTLEVAASLGDLEHTYNCKFYTGASHGVIAIDGVVRDDTVKLLAEKQAAANPNVRGVINRVRVSGTERMLQEQPFLQPTISTPVYFRDGVSGTVKQVIIHPNTRCVVAMVVLGRFVSQQQALTSESQTPERFVVLPMDVVRHMTRDSGFLQINSTDRNRYRDFDPAAFETPHVDWTPPYPYCHAEVLFPIEPQTPEIHSLRQVSQSQFSAALNEKEHSLSEQLLANDSLGG